MPDFLYCTCGHRLPVTDLEGAATIYCRKCKRLTRYQHTLDRLPVAVTMNDSVVRVRRVAA